MTNKSIYNQLHNLAIYNSETGVFTRRVDTGRHGRYKKGTVLGTLHRDGYLRINVGGLAYLAHRLAWLYAHWYMPENEIDHINRVKSDNKMSNLREVSKSCNVRNSDNSKRNTSGVKGVYWHKNRKHWEAKVCVDNKEIHMGCYKNFHNAVCARLAGEQCFRWERCNASTPAYKYVKKMLGWR